MNTFWKVLFLSFAFAQTAGAQAPNYTVTCETAATQHNYKVVFEVENKKIVLKEATRNGFTLVDVSDYDCVTSEEGSGSEAYCFNQIAPSYDFTLNEKQVFPTTEYQIARIGVPGLRKGIYLNCR